MVTLRNDMLGGKVVGGIPFYSGYTPTMPRMKDADGVPISNARLQIQPDYCISRNDRAYCWTEAH